MFTTTFVSWPSAPLTRRLVLNALGQLPVTIHVVHALTDEPCHRLIQWSAYDSIDHELTNARRDSVLASSYTYRKALIRKHYLAHSIHSYLTKNPSSLLKTASPQTFDIDIAFADELDEKWADELYELGCFLDDDPQRWWILKPGMADRGMGIRLFSTKEALYQIFEEFELSDSDDEERQSSQTAVVASQLRHFVIQEYISSPLLLDPREVSVNGRRLAADLQLLGHKFHLRAYCVASGALQLYLYDRVLALFCSTPYSQPRSSADELYPANLESHLTNTSLQIDGGEEGVRLLDELIGCHSFEEGRSDSIGIFTKNDKAIILGQMTEILKETFRAALATPVHFQPLENAFELYGVDFLVEHTPSQTPALQVKILEVNAEPAIELTGPRLTWILEDLFVSIAKVCVGPFIKWEAARGMFKNWKIGDTKEHFIKCLDESVRGSGVPF
ncbi:hypothetical protein AGABI1DRAFT_66676 [Agaricus bisporus var. burnettii JB137-S8]|uniref:Tubulin-tyrosine ligase n=1 Tax=Agaricus bisporus var. burnettii (strain JB137-S8 / ATCC MYA-4627 / FGSC 10392) TaxID=597362 RepID=K5X786_AGABU|nr:uncharacterized protein AGABI1DRAFT_66676 [Agaricus bisporus var. burnettii JB137-S8]EKM83751.1 hypothetical protein AGABI1DRAFT_66676 [Agaricus bisporus var. burnettii JB137-S8]